MTVLAPPPRFQLPGELQRLFGMAEAMYDAQPWYPTSWWRSIDHNRDVGGHPYSSHLIALAFDAKPIDGTVPALAAAAYAAGFPQVVEYPTHVHVGLWRAGTLQRLLNAEGIFLA